MARPELKEGARRFKKFHGRKPDKITHVKIPDFNALVLVGKGMAVEYESDKAVAGRPRKIRHYRHVLGSGVNFYTDPKGRMLIVIGGKFRVTDWLRD